jgi:hypothetical protein
MNIMPFIGFYWRQHQVIADLVGTGGYGKTAPLVINFVKANVPLIKARWPELNKNGMLDDFVNTLDEAFSGAEVQDKPKS